MRLFAVVVFGMAIGAGIAVVLSARAQDQAIQDVITQAAGDKGDAA